MESKLKNQAMDAVGELPAGYLHLPTKPLNSEPELTGWISGDLKPVRDGVYERDYAIVYKKPVFGYALFLNGNWHYGVDKSSEYSIERSANIYEISLIQNLPWRGLASNPNEK